VITLQFGAPRDIDLRYAPRDIDKPLIIPAVASWVYVLPSDPPVAAPVPFVMSQCSRSDAQCAADCRAPECYR